MTYIQVEVFIECMQTSGIKSKYEYYELHNRGIVPTDLMPKSPAVEYNNTYQKAYRQLPKVIAKKEVYAQSPEGKAYQKAYQKKPKCKANRAVYRTTPEAKARQKAYQKRYRNKKT